MMPSVAICTVSVMTKPACTSSNDTNKLPADCDRQIQAAVAQCASV